MLENSYGKEAEIVAADFDRTRAAYFAGLCMLLADIAYLDHLTIHEIDLSIFYLLPVGLAAGDWGLSGDAAQPFWR